MKFTFEDGTVVDHKGALLKFFEADGVTPYRRSRPTLGQEVVVVLGPVRLVEFETTDDSIENGGE